MKLLLTKHAKEKMVERGIALEQIKQAIRMGARIKQTDGYLSSYSYFLVAWKMSGEYYKIKTVMIKD